MVRIQPEINVIKAKYYGDGDTIAEEQTKLFKREKYHPMLSLIPLLLQIVLLMAVIYIINHPLSYLFGAEESTVTALAGFLGISMEDSSYQLLIVDAIPRSRILSLIGLYRAGTHVDTDGIPVDKIADVLRYVRCRNVCVSGMKIVCRDGEISETDTVSVSVVPRALRYRT
jgi:hypothetical protein